MSLRLVSVLSVVGVVASSTAVVAQPAPAPAPAAPAVPAEPPPSDMEGVDENPNAPTIGDDTAASVTVTAPPMKPRGYPIEEAARPITLPQNMSEVSIDPHIQVSPAIAATALHARYGITSQIQIGLTYVLGGLYDNPATTSTKSTLHPGKTVGVDVTYLLQSWIGVKIGVPVYVDPVAIGVTLGAPLRFRLGEKLTVGGMDDLISIAVNGKFAPNFYREGANAHASETNMSNTIQSSGSLRFSAYGIYQYRPSFAIIGRVGVLLEDFAVNRTDGGGGMTTSIRAGFQYTPKQLIDLGLSLGFDDLAYGGSFAPAGYLAVRI
jgi:hypothetical protein